MRYTKYTINRTYFQSFWSQNSVYIALLWQLFAKMIKVAMSRKFNLWGDCNVVDLETFLTTFHFLSHFKRSQPFFFVISCWSYWLSTTFLMYALKMLIITIFSENSTHTCLKKFLIICNEHSCFFFLFWRKTQNEILHI